MIYVIEKYLYLDEDGYLYFVSRGKNWTESLEFCNSQPGFQFGIFDTKASLSVFDYYSIYMPKRCKNMKLMWFESK